MAVVDLDRVQFLVKSEMLVMAAISIVSSMFDRGRDRFLVWCPIVLLVATLTGILWFRDRNLETMQVQTIAARNDGVMRHAATTGHMWCSDMKLDRNGSVKILNDEYEAWIYDKDGSNPRKADGLIIQKGESFILCGAKKNAR